VRGQGSFRQGKVESKTYPKTRQLRDRGAEIEGETHQRRGGGGTGGFDISLEKATAGEKNGRTIAKKTGLA